MKIINFHIYRYHLLPLTTDTSQKKLFEEDKMSIEEIKEKKNDFLKEVLLELSEHSQQKNPLKLEDNEDGFFFIKLANKKSTTIIQDFENYQVENEPFVYIIINNNPLVQKIAISENIDAFSKPKVVRNILREILNKGIHRYGLNINISEMFREETFWEIITKHKDKLEEIDFKYVKPNLANISKSLPEDFRNFTDNVNSHESRIIVKAPKNGVLENITKKNTNVNGLVKYISEGAGGIKLKIKGLSKKQSTKKNPVIIKINEATIEGPAKQVIKVYKSIIES